MAIYSISVRTSATTSANPAADIQGPSGGPNTRLLEFGFTENAATAGVWGLGRPGNDGSQVQTSTSTVQAEDGGNAAAGKTTAALTWSTAPTVPGNFFRRVSCPGSIGAGLTWTFPRGLIFVATKGIVLWIIATVPVADVWWVVDE